MKATEYCARKQAETLIEYIAAMHNTHCMILSDKISNGLQI